MPILVDFSQVMMSTLMSQQGFFNEKIEEDLLRHMILNCLRSYRVKFKKEYGELIICCDNSFNWRREVYPLYKANRRKEKEESEIDWDEIFNSFNKIKSELQEFFPYPVVHGSNAEGDDVIAVLTKHFQMSEEVLANNKVLILSGDKDFIQLHTNGVDIVQYDPVHKKRMKPETTSSDYLIEKILRGDGGDGVPNLLSDDDVFITENKRQSSITAKRLEEWKRCVKNNVLHEFLTTEQLRKNYERNKNMVDLSLIPTTVKNSILENYTSEVNRTNETKRKYLFNYFVKHKMSLLLEHINEF